MLAVHCSYYDNAPPPPFIPVEGPVTRPVHNDMKPRIQRVQTP